MAKKKFFDTNLFSSILYVVLGVLLIAFPGDALSWAMTIAGVFFIISGVLELVKKNWFGGAISLIIGIVILVLGWTVIDIVLRVLGVLIAVKGVIALIDVLKRRKKNFLSILFAVLTIAIGVVLVFAYGDILKTIVIIAGILLVINGVIGLISALKK